MHFLEKCVCQLNHCVRWKYALMETIRKQTQFVLGFVQVAYLVIRSVLVTVEVTRSNLKSYCLWKCPRRSKFWNHNGCHNNFMILLAFSNVPHYLKWFSLFFCHLWINVMEDWIACKNLYYTNCFFFFTRHILLILLLLQRTVLLFFLPHAFFHIFGLTDFKN